MSGLRNTVSRLLLERRFGVSTSEHVDFAELGYEGTDRFRYEPSGWLSLPLALPRHHVRPHDVLADLGSGKGRVLLQAASYPLRRVIGVELSPQLMAIAEENVSRADGRLRVEVELVNEDVLEWRIPDDLTIAYMYNPFLGELFSQVVDRLAEFAERTARPLRVVYVNPEEHERMAAHPRVRELPGPDGLLPRLVRLPPGEIRRYVVEPG
jgi:SAM-dependent methyltransferase